MKWLDEIHKCCLHADNRFVASASSADISAHEWWTSGSCNSDNLLFNLSRFFNLIYETNHNETFTEAVVVLAYYCSCTRGSSRNLLSLQPLNI